MTKFKPFLLFENGEELDLEEEFDSEEEAVEYGFQSIADYHTGMEVLHMSNPGDYPEENEDIEVIIREES